MATTRWWAAAFGVLFARAFFCGGIFGGENAFKNVPKK